MRPEENTNGMGTMRGSRISRRAISRSVRKMPIACCPYSSNDVVRSMKTRGRCSVATNSDRTLMAGNAATEVFCGSRKIVFDLFKKFYNG